ncbi:ATP-dependent DNA ligase [Streptomyces sp. NPDC003487]
MGETNRRLSHETHRNLENDGYRALLFTGPVRLQSRRGSLIQARFPGLVRAAADLPDGLLLDGELVVWTGEGLSFEALQRRAAAGHLSAPLLAEELPAYLIVFDALQDDGRELLHACTRAAPAWRSSSPTMICTRRGCCAPRRMTRQRRRNGSRPGPASRAWKGSSSGAPSGTTCAAPASCTRFAAATPPKPLIGAITGDL